LKNEKETFSLKMIGIANQAKRGGIESNVKLNKLEQENEVLKKKMRKMKSEVDLS
jgi:hypothetical protein